MNKLLKYNHPAKTKYNLDKLYTLDELKEELNMGQIKVLFTPINFDFDELDIKKKISKAELKETSNLTNY